MTDHTPNPPPIIDLTRSLKARMDEARVAFESYLVEASKAETQAIHPEHGIARSLAAQTGMESRRLAYEMRLSDWQQANNEAAALRHAEDGRRAHRLNVALFACAIVGGLATVASAIGTGIQAYVALRPPLAASVAPATSAR